MNWPLFICGLVLFGIGAAVGAAALICLSAGYAAAKPFPKLSTSSTLHSQPLRARRQPGETDSDLAGRLLNASPYHQMELNAKSQRTQSAQRSNHDRN